MNHLINYNAENDKIYISEVNDDYFHCRDIKGFVIDVAIGLSASVPLRGAQEMLENESQWKDYRCDIIDAIDRVLSLIKN
jgi:hypothetical protein